MVVAASCYGEQRSDQGKGLSFSMTTTQSIQQRQQWRDFRTDSSRDLNPKEHPWRDLKILKLTVLLQQQNPVQT